MSATCQSFRDAWLETAPGGRETRAFASAAHCPECDAWQKRQMLVTRALLALEPLRAPELLLAATANEIEAGSEARFVRLLGGLEPRVAPRELEERLESEGFYAIFLRRLSVERAPHVLERLVAEELVDPAASTRRFAGSLPRRRAPLALAERLAQRRFAPVAPRRLVPLAAALAASLALWLGWRARQTDEPRYAFRVRTAEASALEPLARQLGAALGGGVGLAVEPVPPARERAAEALR